MMKCQIFIYSPFSGGGAIIQNAQTLYWTFAITSGEKLHPCTDYTSYWGGVRVTACW